jgi:hypothetical protein
MFTGRAHRTVLVLAAPEATSNLSVACTAPGGINLAIPGLEPKVTMFMATLYAVLLGLSLRI